MSNHIAIIPMIVGGLSLSACGITGPAHTQLPPVVAHATVTMGMTSFNPADVRIRVGQTVLWRNTSLMTHTVTADPRRAANPGNVQLPQGATVIHSGNIPAGQVWSYTFTRPGTYRYVCLPHEQRGMTGTVIVDG